MRHLKIFPLFSISAAIILMVSSGARPAAETLDKLRGVWVYADHHRDTYYFYKAMHYVEAKPGVQFKDSGKIILRGNVSWCGTPPKTYTNYKGTWKYKSSGIIKMRHSYWGGTARETWEVIHLNYDTLVVKKTRYRSRKSWW